MYPCFAGPCSAYSEVCARAKPLREAYARIVEPVMGYPRRGELWAAWAVALGHPDPWGACAALGRALERLRDSRACVLGPLARRLPEGCDTVIAVEGIENVDPGLAVDADMIVGDGDSSEPHLLERLCSEKTCFLHVHGDNYLEAYRLVRATRAIPTSQAYCYWPVLGVGGFTDGDRALLIAALLGARSVVAVGFDFSRPSQAHKHRVRPLDSRVKILKLSLARRVLEAGARALGMRLFLSGSIVVLEKEN